MLEKDRDPIVAICLLAALADGERSAEEHAQFQRIAARLGADPDSGLSVRAENKELTLAEAAERLSSPEARRTAMEMSISVIYADGQANPGELAFLAELRKVIAAADEETETLQREVETLALAPLTGPLPDTTAGTLRGHAPRPSQAGIPALSHDAALDTLIRKQALLTGALELLPQNLASLAIIPLQMRLVYRIGKDFGHNLDSAQIKDLLGTLGIGAAAQVMDGMARRILGGLGRGMFGRTLGGIVGGTAGAAAGAGVSFVTTYALGYAARQYYEQGRTLSTEDLRALFQRFKREAEELLPKVQEEIHQQASHLDLKRVLASVKGTPS
jgi:uncharacterized protein (DUF697 family)